MRSQWNRGRILAWTLGALSLPLCSLAGWADHFVWVDESGLTHFTDDPEAAASFEGTSSGIQVDHLRNLWGGVRTGPTLQTPPGASGRREDRIVRMMLGAIEDMDRGETARAEAALRSALRLDPRRPEPHWYLARLARSRGRYAQAQHELKQFLRSAGPPLARWRGEAEILLQDLAADAHLADESVVREPTRWTTATHEDFQLRIDRELIEAQSDWAQRAMRFLEEAREELSQLLGVQPSEPLSVIFYGRAAYQKAHADRFSFRTAGFFDGRIHVVASAHATERLRALLFHEYSHALFREQTGGDRPYWLNEGLAEQFERRARSKPISTRSERAQLRAAIQSGEWIPLSQIAQSFSGLQDEDARLAYLESIVVVEWMTAHTDRAARTRLLKGLGQGRSADLVLYETLGLDTQGLDQAVRSDILSEFPAAPEVADLGR